MFERPIAGGLPITLEIPEDHWITWADWQALVALRAALVVHTLTIRGASVRVKITGLELRLLIDYADPDPDDPVVGTIKLTTV